MDNYKARYSLAELKQKKTISHVNGDELKVQTQTMRVWLSSDETQAIVEQYFPDHGRLGRWETIETYEVE